MTCRTARTPWPDRIAALDREMGAIAAEHGTDTPEARYHAALSVIAYGERGISHGMLRLDPAHAVRPAKAQRPVVDDVVGKGG